MSDEITRLEGLLTGIARDQIPLRAYGVLGAVILLNIVLLAGDTRTYMVLWILSSLYFYLSYPLLPLALTLIQFLKKSPDRRGDSIPVGTLVTWVKNLQIFNYRVTGVQLFIRFFILSIVPLTAGIILIYSTSLIFSFLLWETGTIPEQTSILILVQCLGILIFYLDAFLFRHQFYVLTRSLFVISSQNWRRYLLIGIIGIIFVFIASIAVIILLIAIVLPGFTLGVYVDVTDFIQNRTNFLILLIIASQFVTMQYLQSILSRTIARDIIEDLCFRLISASHNLATTPDLDARSSPDTRCLREHILSLLLEARFHAVTRYQLAGLFPTYAVFVNVSSLLSVRTLGDLQGMFVRKR